MELKICDTNGFVEVKYLLVHQHGHGISEVGDKEASVSGLHLVARLTNNPGAHLPRVFAGHPQRRVDEHNYGWLLSVSETGTVHTALSHDRCQFVQPVHELFTWPMAAISLQMVTVNQDYETGQKVLRSCTCLTFPRRQQGFEHVSPLVVQLRRQQISFQAS